MSTRGAALLCDDGLGAVAVLMAAPADPDGRLLDAARQRLAELLTGERLTASVARLAQAEQMQHALFDIADMAGSDLDMTTMLRGLHGIVAGLMYAANFYIVMYQRERAALTFLYFADTVDADGPKPGEEISMSRIERGVTWYLVNDGRPMMGNREQLEEQASGLLNRHGAYSLDWLGVPMLRNGEVLGGVVVQSYDESGRYGERERALLVYVADHILTAVERKRSREELETRVAERTQQLAAANTDLQQQIRERLRAEHLQATLYRIAALANVDESSQTFYRELHRTIGELLNAENFYVALLTGGGQTPGVPLLCRHDPGASPASAIGQRAHRICPSHRAGVAT